MYKIFMYRFIIFLFCNFFCNFLGIRKGEKSELLTVNTKKRY
jgi:hypothetical protein